jgi:hypothetical protein
MHYLDKALSDLVFARDMIQNEVVRFSGADSQSLQGILADLDSVITDYEYFLRDKDY